jgi:DNA-binding XRE family transcriptional regulator
MPSTRFSDFMKEVEEEARREGPAAVAESEAFRAHFIMAREFVARRQALGLTQRQLAERSGVQQSEISRIEQGSSNPTFHTIHVLARALKAEFHLVNMGKRGTPRASRRAPAAHRSARRATTKRSR